MRETSTPSNLNGPSLCLAHLRIDEPGAYKAKTSERWPPGGLPSPDLQRWVVPFMASSKKAMVDDSCSGHGGSNEMSPHEK